VRIGQIGLVAKAHQRSMFRKVAIEAQNSYYSEMFNSKTNSIKKLWENLNTVCSFKKKEQLEMWLTSYQVVAKWLLSLEKYAMNLILTFQVLATYYRMS